jgi:hypothetical protein
VKTHVEFRSDRFPAYDSEEKEINPGRYGKRLAQFISDRLRTKGFEPQDPVAEDWGWMIPIKNEGFWLWIGCGNYDEYSDGFLCFIEPHEPFIRRFLRKIETRDRVESLQKAIDEVLSDEAGIQEKRWWSHEEFNKPSG